mmetsp:Transcript_29366/g.32510  ORF Transcript_29366/g.32510 Transcript_29366/m.32510 type:complete len:729 (+) Transcript_29366:372-2558(+)
MTHLSVSCGEYDERQKENRDDAIRMIKKEEKKRDKICSTFLQKVEDPRKSESWEYPDVISVHSSAISSLTGGVYPSHSVMRNHQIDDWELRRCRNVDSSKVSDTEYNLHTPKLSNATSTEISSKESSGNCLVKNRRSDSMLTLKPARGTSAERDIFSRSKPSNYRLSMRWGALGVITAIIIIASVLVASNKGSKKLNHDELEQERKEVEQVKLTPREQALMKIFRTVSTDGLEKKDTPQYQAKEWIFDSDQLKLTALETIGDERIIQRYVLAVFYYSTNGPESWKSNNWLEGDECSNLCWTGINCNDDNIVQAISFDNAGLQGTLPNEIGSLTMMENLIIKNHPLLVGNISSGIGKLKLLVQLGLYNNGLTGGIPVELYLATNLRYINLQNNHLEGKLAVTIEQMRNLEKLILFNNRFNGRIPVKQFARTKIRFLGLSNNDFSGSLPNQISNLPRLKYFHLKNNKLTGTIPLNIGRLTNMISLNFDNNNFRGSIPNKIGNMNQLIFLSLHGNILTGSIPFEFASTENLRMLNLGANKLSGEIPSFSPDSNLTHIHLFQNKLQGTLPLSLSHLKKLEVLFLSSNRLHGKIESILSDLKDTLQGLYLSDNKFTGLLPNQLCGMVNLKALFLDKNDFYGPLPECIGSLSNIRQLFLFSNELSGTVPESLGALRKLSQLGLENNKLQGQVPDYICSNDALAEVWVDCGGQNPKVQCTCCSTCCPSLDCQLKI